MSEDLLGSLFLLNRFLHIVAAALLLGGTVFYELVVPVAIADMKEEQRLSIFARARWAFRWVVWCSAIILLLSGLVSTARNWYVYRGDEAAQINHTQLPPPQMLHIEGVGYWWLSHAVGAVMALCVALALVRGPIPPAKPIVWMRINILILLLVILLASATRDARIRLLNRQFNTPQSID